MDGNPIRKKGDQKNRRKWRGLLLIGLALTAFLAGFWPALSILHTAAAAPAPAPAHPTGAQSKPLPPIPYYYAGPEGAFSVALSLYPRFMPVAQPAEARVLIIIGRPPEAAAVNQALSQGAGLVWLLTPEVSAADFQQLLGFAAELSPADQPLSLVAAPGSQDPLTQDIIWNSAPQVRERVQLVTPSSALLPLVVGYDADYLAIGRLQLGQSTVFLFTPLLGEANKPLQEWAYFNYMVYHLVAQAAGERPLSFAAYPASPVPHQKEQVVLLTILSGLLILAFIIFSLVRRYSRQHPEALDVLVSNRVEFERRQSHSEWDQVGFHRPLGGFLLAFMLGLLFFIPIIIYQNLVLPVYILPSAQALGIWGRVVQFFNFLWLFLDMGTSAAFIKFFSEYRVHDPRKAIQFGQVFVWWQALSGAAQVAFFVFLGSVILPNTTYALYAWSVVIHAMIQIPGFYQVMRHSLMAWQRFDYAQILELGLALILPILTQPLLVTLMVAWGRTHPVFGPSLAGVLGLGIAAYCSEALTFLLGLFLYRRLGYNARLLFLAHFDWATVKQAFRFGVFEMLGSVSWALGQAGEILITQARLINYNEIWGNWGLAQNFIFAFNVSQTLYSNLLPSISEAISNARLRLSQYYAANAYKWGGMLSAFVGAVLLAVADRFILGASGPEFTRAATYAIPLIIWGAVQYPSWVGDHVQLASNRPYLKASMVFAEQVVRITIAWLLITRLQITGLIIAYFIGLTAKGISAYFINHRLCFPQRFYFWQSLGAPLLAGAGHYLLLRWVTGLIWQGDQITSVLIFLIGILFSYPIFAFLYGLAGGWDQATLDELRLAVPLSGPMQWMARVFYLSTALGARLSPLHNRFPIDLYQEAQTEAQSLTQERAKI